MHQSEESVILFRNYVYCKREVPVVKKEIHPDYHSVVFRDTGANYSFLTRSTATSNQTVKWEDGQEYPLINIDISSKSHPFYTGQQRFGKARGRIEKFNKRYGKTEE